VLAKSVPLSVERFIRGHIPTLAHLETLLCLRGDADQWWSADAVAKRLGIPRVTADAILVDLCSHGLLSVSVAGHLSYRFSPASPTLSNLVEKFVVALRSNRAQVAAVILENTR
jgi:hypothetical protein